MNIINEEEINKASLDNSKAHYVMAFSELLHSDADIDFRAGLSFAEKKLTSLMFDFVEWVSLEGFIMQDGWKNVMNAKIPESQRFSTKQLFEQFLAKQK